MYYMQDQEEYKISAILDKESFEKISKRAKLNDRTVSAELRVLIKECTQ